MAASSQDAKLNAEAGRGNPFDLSVSAPPLSDLQSRLAPEQQVETDAKANANATQSNHAQGEQMAMQTNSDPNIPNSNHVDPLAAPSAPESALFDADAQFLIARYDRLQKIGEGTYGVVFKSFDKVSKKFVALKKIRLDTEDDGVPSTAVREISLLQEVRHPNVVSLLDVIHESSRLYLVFEFVEMDLKRYLTQKGRIEGVLLKSYLRQMLKGLAFCHQRRIMHRDIKPQNLLIDRRGNLKLADFGLSRVFSKPERSYTNEVVTLWYRSPEILLGGRHYTTAVDIWSVACVWMEMAAGRPLFTGDSEIHQLYQIFSILGTPSESTWNGVQLLPHFKDSFPKWTQRRFYEIEPFRAFGSNPTALDLLLKMLEYDPHKRISAAEALRHPFFDDLNALNTANTHWVGLRQILVTNVQQFGLERERDRDSQKRKQSEIGAESFVGPPPHSLFHSAVLHADGLRQNHTKLNSGLDAQVHSDLQLDSAPVNQLNGTKLEDGVSRQPQTMVQRASKRIMIIGADQRLTMKLALDEGPVKVKSGQAGQLAPSELSQPLSIQMRARQSAGLSEEASQHGSDSKIARGKAPLTSFCPSLHQIFPARSQALQDSAILNHSQLPRKSGLLEQGSEAAQASKIANSFPAPPQSPNAEQGGVDDSDSFNALSSASFQSPPVVMRLHPPHPPINSFAAKVSSFPTNFPEPAASNSSPSFTDLPSLRPLVHSVLQIGSEV